MTEIEKAITAFEAAQEDEGNPILTFGTLKFYAVAEPACKEALAALREKQERSVNPLLTLEELRGMRWQPVWVKSLEAPERRRWGIVVGVNTQNGHRTLYCQGDYAYRGYGKTWVAYRRPPEGDDR